MATLIGIAAAVVLVLIGVAVVAFFRSLAEERARTAERETARLRAMLEEVKEIAWTNREIAPDLATIIIDTIRTREETDRRRQLP
jgi:ABC-type bacteriocin/lantibiotic exporter with double-glycine peptidase domain